MTTAATIKDEAHRIMDRMRAEVTGASDS